MAIHQKTIEGRKAYFNKMRALVNAQWILDNQGVVHIPLNLGREALIDVCDLELAQQFFWRLRIHSRKTSNKCYAEAVVPEDARHLTNTDKRSISLHRLLMGSPEGLQIDHINANGLDCRRSNMRPATASQNTSNRRYANKTGFRGVCRRGRKYIAQCDHLGVHYSLGSYNTAEEAALAYNKFALERFGEFAILNDVEVAICQSAN